MICAAHGLLNDIAPALLPSGLDPHACGLLQKLDSRILGPACPNLLQEKQPEYLRTEEDADQLSAAVWRAAWPRERLQQRAFFTFGQKMLLALDLQVQACIPQAVLMRATPHLF
jgi:hypothetical protein